MQHLHTMLQCDDIQADAPASDEMFDAADMETVEMLSLNDLVEGSFSDELLGMCWDAQDGDTLGSEDGNQENKEGAANAPPTHQRNMKKAEAARVRARIRI